MNNLGLDWDYDYPKFPYIFVSIYAPTYKTNNLVRKICYSDLKYQITDFKALFEHIKTTIGYDPETDEPILGINSNSLVNAISYNTGYLFFDWDIHKYCPNLDTILNLGDLVIDTGKGYHAIKNEIMSIEEAHKKQVTARCCEGFTKCTIDKRFSTLRVSQKGGRPIKIIKYTDSLFFNVYKQLVLDFGGIYEPIS